MSIPVMPTMLKCILCGLDIEKKDVDVGNAKRIDEYTCVCSECLPNWEKIPDQEKEQLLSITSREIVSRVIRSFCIGILSFFYRLFMAIYEMIKRHPVVLIYVILITAYGIFCMLGFWNFFRERRMLYRLGVHKVCLLFVPPIGIWLSWSGLNKLINAGRDFDHSFGYMKIMGGTALIIIMHFFLIVIR